MFIILPIGDIAPRERTPYVNYVLLGVNIALFLLLGLRADYRSIVLDYGVVPAHPQWSDFITSMFLHADIFHLGGNMLFLWIVGDNVEDVLGHLGYLGFYLVGGVVAMVPHVLLLAGSEVPCIGASGAISAVMAAYAVWFSRNRIKIWYLIGFFYIRAGVALVPAVVAVGLWFALQLLYGLLTVRAQVSGGVGYWVHIGGFVFGLVVALAARTLWSRRIPRITVEAAEPGRRYFRPRRPNRYDGRGGAW